VIRYVLPVLWLTSYVLINEAWIRPVLKVTAPTQHSDFRPISITPVLTRALERTIVHDFIYPALQNPTTSLVFHGQFAFRPSGSTTAAIITLLHKVTHLPQTSLYVIVIALDFSKAFDTVRHHILLDKIAQLDLPNHIYNWLVNFFNGHSHQTKYGNVMSAFKSMQALFKDQLSDRRLTLQTVPIYSSVYR